jgi:hypothetical protein
MVGADCRHIDNLNMISGMRRPPRFVVRAWYEQHIGDWLRIRIGQQAQELISTEPGSSSTRRLAGDFAGAICPQARTIRGAFPDRCNDELPSLPGSLMAIPLAGNRRPTAAGWFGRVFASMTASWHSTSPAITRATHPGRVPRIGASPKRRRTAARHYGSFAR